MIITTTCPLRISLVGGSTDHPHYLDKYGVGSVISFPCNLKTYITIHKDVFGINSIGKRFILNYSVREEVDTIEEIKNELIKNCFDRLDVSHINLFLTSDVYSSGSGLATSSAYLMALIKSIYVMRDQNITESEICKIAMSIEKTFNPLVGQQDFYGSMGGFKRINFHKNESPSIKYLDTKIFDDMDMYLIYTGIARNSTDILKTVIIDNSKYLIEEVEKLESAINTSNFSLFHDTIRTAWEKKKNISTDICSNKYLIELDNKIESDKNILSHKLLGAGNGGYFLIFTKKEKEIEISKTYPNSKKISISDRGISYNKI